MVLAAGERGYRQKHEKMPYHDGTFKRWAEKPSAEFPYHFMDGVRFSVGDTPAPNDLLIGGDARGD
jgi:hypothetical protein